MSSSYYFALTGGYALALAGWWFIHRWKPYIWEPRKEYQFSRPWKDLLWAFVASVAVIAIGQLYVNDYLLPRHGTALTEVVEVFNQIIIFSPFLLLLLLRRQPLTTAWLPPSNVAERLIIGFSLALGAICFFVLIQQPTNSLRVILRNVYHPRNIGYAVQIFLQEAALAILFVRFRSAVGQRWFLLVLISIAFFFSASHYPEMLREGIPFLTATYNVLMDGILVSAVIYVLQKSRDILWFWFVHFAMDMMQFYSGSPVS